ncbi:MAG: hypothetical protein FWF46_05480 [Oscillospiraceae bacterium]|nr:hypothetical protein [Oscillospiraceae bacterium]
MFKLLKIKPKKEVDYVSIYSSAYRTTLDRCVKSITTVEELKENKLLTKRLIYYGVKYVGILECSDLRISDYNMAKDILDVTQMVKSFAMLLTPNEFMTIFPIRKDYKSGKFGCKDYFYTVEKINEIGAGSIIGSKNVDKFLWDYSNDEVCEFVVNYMSIINYFCKVEKGFSPLEVWCEEQGFESYVIYTDEVTKKQYWYDKDSNKMTPVKQPIPRYLKLIKGGCE